MVLSEIDPRWYSILFVDRMVHEGYRQAGIFLRYFIHEVRQSTVTKNAADSSMVHSVDFHAATGRGGGAAATQVTPGHEKHVKFKALVPGLYVYHCATPMVAQHIANGMYGLILVEPEADYPPSIMNSM
jgi:hypothetical protein